MHFVEQHLILKETRVVPKFYCVLLFPKSQSWYQSLTSGCIHCSCLNWPQVQKHFEKLQQEKEESASTKLQSLMPQLGSIVRSLALKETEWNVDKAALLLRRFHVANASKLVILQKVSCAQFMTFSCCGRVSDWKVDLDLQYNLKRWVEYVFVEKKEDTG